MARETDFLDLYRALGLDPGCGLIEFKQAYRRRVSELHPDRRIGNALDRRAAERLQRLTALYRAAMAFQHRHGRLPGAPQARAIQPASVVTPHPRSPEAVTATPRRRSRWLLILPAAAIAGWLLWGSEPLPSPVATPPEQATPDGNSAEDAAAPARTLELGMDTDTVRSMEGDPIIVSDGRWEYGPSWVRFENNKVTDWYSSALHPLKTARRQTARTQP